MGAAHGQHYLPRLLLKGFASRKKEKKAWVFYFRKDAPGKEVSVRDVGKEADFHGSPRDSDLEGRMASVETIFAPYVARWREGKFLPEVDEEIIAQFIGHLSIRTRSVREAFSGGAEVLMDELLRRFEGGEFNPFRHPDIESEMMKRMSKKPQFSQLAKQKPREFKALVRASIAQLNRSGKPTEWIRQMAEGARAAINVKESVARGHIKSLTENQIPTVRVQLLRSLTWSVVNTQQIEMILGDVGAIAKGTGDAQFQQPLALDFDKLSIICCPIGRKSVLVGRATGSDHSISANEINQASAELSREFFIAAERNERFDDFQRNIGKRAEVMSQEDIRKLIPTEMPPFGREEE